MGFQTTVRAASPRGRGEDRSALIACGETLVVVVADGAGGQPGGAEAAEIVVRSVTTALPSCGILEDPETWRAMLLAIDQEVERDPAAGETTAVVAAVSPSGIVGAGVGDSEVWLVDSQGYDVLTRHQSRRPFLGDGAWPQVFQATATGTLLAATDGLFKYADADEICRLARRESLDDAAKGLIDLVRVPSGDLWDDVTVVLCRL